MKWQTEGSHYVNRLVGNQPVYNGTSPFEKQLNSKLDFTHSKFQVHLCSSRRYYHFHIGQRRMLLQKHQEQAEDQTELEPIHHLQTWLHLLIGSP